MEINELKIGDTVIYLGEERLQLLETNTKTAKRGDEGTVLSIDTYPMSGPNDTVTNVKLSITIKPKTQGGYNKPGQTYTAMCNVKDLEHVR